MCSVLDESDDILQELLSVLLMNLTKEMKDSSLAAHSLSLNVVTTSAEKLRPYLREKIPSDESICRHGYHQIVYDIFRHGSGEFKPNFRDEKRNDGKLVSSSGGRKECSSTKRSRFREEKESKDVSLTEYTASEANSTPAL